MIIQKRSLGWLPKPSAYGQVASGNAKRKASNEAFLGSQSSVATSFTNIQANFVSESVNLSSQAAAARLGIKLK